MARHDPHGRRPWLAVVVVVFAFVLADSIRSPLFPDSEAPAVARPRLTLWVPGPEAGGEAALVAREAAADLARSGRAAVVRRLPGGTSEAPATLLSRPARRRGADLLVLSGSTLIALERDQEDRLVPGAAGAALEARALLRRSHPLGILSRDPLVLAAFRGSGIRTTGGLLARIRSSPGSCVFAIADGGYSQVELARLVDQIGEGGTAHYIAYGSGALAAQSTGAEGANLVLAPRPAVTPQVRAGRLRALRWPLGPASAPHTWVGLVAPAAYGPGRESELRALVGGLTTSRRWRSGLRAGGRSTGGAGSAGLHRLIAGTPSRG